MLQFYKKTLIKLFADINDLKRKPSNIALSFFIQEQLLNRIRRVEKKIRSIKTENGIISSQIRNGRLPKEAAKHLKDLVAYNNQKKDFYTSLLLIYRDIGDALAFIYLNKWDIKPLVLAKEAPGFISHKKGLRLELKAFRHSKSKGVLCIFNDITNSLRHGDLTFPVNGIPSLVELKSGNASKDNGRAKRQHERAVNILNYLKEDVGKNVYPEQGETTMYRRDTLNRERNHLQSFRNILSMALKNNTNILTKIEGGLYYNVMVKEDGLEKTLNTLPKNISPIFISVNDFKKYKQGYYPFTLLINDPEALYKFYNGEYTVFVIIDANYITSELAKEGFAVEFLSEEGYFLKLNDPVRDIQVTISRHFFGRIAGEFLNLKWMVKEFISRLDTFNSVYNPEINKLEAKEDLVKKVDP